MSRTYSLVFLALSLCSCAGQQPDEILPSPELSTDVTVVPIPLGNGSPGALDLGGNPLVFSCVINGFADAPTGTAVCSGTVCDADADCAGDPSTFCALDTCAVGTCLHGTCSPCLPSGSPCTRDAQCISGVCQACGTCL